MVYTYILHWFGLVLRDILEHVWGKVCCTIGYMVIYMLEINLCCKYMVYDLKSDVKVTFTVKKPCIIDLSALMGQQSCMAISVSVYPEHNGSKIQLISYCSLGQRF